MTSDEIEFLAQLSEATVLTLRGDLRGAEECLSQGEPAEHAALNELKAATTLLIRRLSETLAAKESALASVQLSMLELESARDELQAKEARYRELVSNMNEGVVVCEAVDQGADFVIREINRAALRTESMESSNPRGQRLTSVLPGAKDCGLLDALRRVHATGAAEQMSRHAYQVGHQCGWREGFVYQLPTGEVVAVYRDVTAQRASEEALRASNERFQSLTRTALDAIIILDPAGCIETWNPAAEMIFGYAARDAVGKDARQLLVLKDDWALHRAADCGKEETGLETAVSKTLEQEVRRRDGTLIPVELTLSMFRNEDGWRVAAIVRDVSARRQAESGLRQERILLRTVVDHLPDGVYAKDTEGRRTLTNMADVRILGYNTEAALLGRTDFELLPRQDAVSGILDDQSVIRGGMPIINREESFVNRLGRKVSLQTSKIPLRNETGEVVGLVGISHDITERKRAEEDRARMEVQLRHAQKLESIGQLAAGIAHEINTPIQFVGDNLRFLAEAFSEWQKPLVSFENLLAAGRTAAIPAPLIAEVEASIAAADLPYLSAEIPKAIAQSLEGVTRVSKIVLAMKDFSHPGEAEKSACQLNRAIESTLTVCRNEWKYVAELVTDLDPNLPPVPCLVGEFNQVVLNLVINAAHAIADVVGSGEKGKGTITVSTRHDGEWVEVRVQDTGGGIPEAAREHVFTPFFTTKPVGKGTGQGLAVAWSVVVDKHQGTIRFETEVGRGTTFIIRLPLIVKAAPTGPRRARPALAKRF